MTYFRDEKVKPDTLTKGDYIFDSGTKNWEPVKAAYWSEASQRYVVWCGPLGYCLHLYRGMVTRRRYY